MLAHRRQRLLALSLVLVGLLGWWFARQRMAPEAPNSGADLGQPDYIVDGVRALILNESGQPLRRVSADQLRHYPADDSSELDQPRLFLYDQGAPPWHIRAERGWISADAEKVILTEQVRAQRAAFDDNAELRLGTNQIAVFPDQQFAETDQLVTLESGADVTTAANGMYFWYSAPMHANLFGRVQARIAPQPDDADNNQEH